ncbi:predicted protein [Nematostella vectensis]|uniref:Uncharacterized protein n=1 Tax=Nematostella vectensis TaxID=45351 RepID=A7S872_NEMVE|nr:predicted protein [Nematostella vectensis]|eukprot:XP_001632178.1 predicted protein [Nematostella vectensis]
MELNQRRKELIKPDLNNEYRHLCSSSSNVTITDQLFGDDLAKEVKELTEVNRVGKRVTTTNPTAYPRSRDNRNLGAGSYGSRGRMFRTRKSFLDSRNYGNQQTFNTNQTRKFNKQKRGK